VLKSQNRFAALEILDTELDVYKAWEIIREDIKISAKESLGYYEQKKNKPWFVEECSKSLDQGKQSQIAVVTRSKQNKCG
jgi:hypothetical protein